MPGSQFRPVLALSLLLTIGALMGLTSILVKLAGNVGWPAMAYLLWSLLGGGLLLLLFTWIRGERPGISPGLLGYYLASGLLSIAVPNGLLFSSIGHVGACSGARKIIEMCAINIDRATLPIRQRNCQISQ